MQALKIWFQRVFTGKWKNRKQNFLQHDISLSRMSMISRLQNPAINISSWSSSYLTYLGYLSVDYYHSLLLEILSSLGFLDNTPCIFLTSLHALCSFSLISKTLNVGVSRIQPNVCPFSSTSILLVQFHDFKSQMYIFSVGLSPRLQPTWEFYLLVW